MSATATFSGKIEANGGLAATGIVTSDTVEVSGAITYSGYTQNIVDAIAGSLVVEATTPTVANNNGITFDATGNLNHVTAATNLTSLTPLFAGTYLVSYSVSLSSAGTPPAGSWTVFLNTTAVPASQSLSRNIVQNVASASVLVNVTNATSTIALVNTSGASVTVGAATLSVSCIGVGASPPPEEFVPNPDAELVLAPGDPSATWTGSFNALKTVGVTGGIVTDTLEVTGNIHAGSSGTLAVGRAVGGSLSTVTAATVAVSAPVVFTTPGLLIGGVTEAGDHTGLIAATAGIYSISAHIVGTNDTVWSIEVGGTPVAGSAIGTSFATASIFVTASIAAAGTVKLVNTGSAPANITSVSLCINALV